MLTIVTKDAEQYTKQNMAFLKGLNGKLSMPKN